eukprot:TRINITY_DN36648_c0_g1_i4.p1 TRINITY_DN36648_c0_g1~~TRINITY_DN36648_c0_g1_i4.p1  ORF type:complete len:489 (-),score=146.93 TRINITY_DN36648_c0_g1_i4:102-1568(-)
MDSNSKSVDLMNKEHFNHALGEDILPTVDDDDDLDDEVRSCLVGLPSYKPGADHSSSPDSCSFYSSCTQDDLGSQVDTMSTNSFYSTGTLRDVDTDTASFCSVETLQEKEDEEEEEELKELEDEQKPEDNFQTCDTSEEIPDLPRDRHPECHKPEVPQSPSGTPSGLSYSRPSYLAGSKMSVTTGSSSSLVSETELSFAGHVNDRLGKLLGYVGRGAEGVPTQDALASIVGYEIVNKEKEKFTIYKIGVCCPSTLPITWYIHRRYSDFHQLRKTLMKENQQNLSKISFPPKRWVGSNLEPSFLGRRLACLQVFLASVLEIKDIKSNPALQSFLCLDKPPADAVNGLESSRAICDTLEEAVKELREQLRKREMLEMEVEHQKNMNAEKDQQIDNLCKENVLLRQQKETLMNVLSSGRRSSSSRNLADPNPDSSKSRIETLKDFTAKFNLKNGEGPLASSTPSKSSKNSQAKLGTRRRMHSQGEGLSNGN